MDGSAPSDYSCVGSTEGERHQVQDVNTTRWHALRRRYELPLKLVALLAKEVALR